jgi:HD superfamily phosphohydrolase
MISGGIQRMIDDGIEAAKIKAMDDEELFSSMTAHGGIASEMISRIKSRRLFKRAVYVGLESLESYSRSLANDRRIAQEIADLAGLDHEYVLVDNPSLPDAEEGDFPVLVDGEVKPLRDVSPLVAILEKANRANWRFGVYCRIEDREKVAQVARKCLNLKKGPIQHTLKDIDNGYL